MDVHTQALLDELTRRWLTLDVETQELLVMTTRLFTEHSGNVTYEGLPHYEEATKRMDRELREKYGKKTESQETLDLT